MPMEEPVDAHFIPPAAEPVVRSPRMPQIEDLPSPVQQQWRAREGQISAQAAPETRRRSLLEKLAAFGITRHDDETAAPAPAVATLPRPAPINPGQAEIGRPQPRPQQVRSAVSGGLDPHGRPTPRPPATEDDHLEIPAFLRRQQN